MAHNATQKSNELDNKDLTFPSLYLTKRHSQSYIRKLILKNKKRRKIKNHPNTIQQLFDHIKEMSYNQSNQYLYNQIQYHQSITTNRHNHKEFKQRLNRP